MLSETDPLLLDLGRCPARAVASSTISVWPDFTSSSLTTCCSRCPSSLLFCSCPPDCCWGMGNTVCSCRGDSCCCCCCCGCASCVVCASCCCSFTLLPPFIGCVVLPWSRTLVTLADDPDRKLSAGLKPTLPVRKYVWRVPFPWGEKRLKKVYRLLISSQAII